MFKGLFGLAVLLLASCGDGTQAVLVPSQCSLEADFIAQEVQYFPDLIRMSGRWKSASLDLVRNEMTCLVPQGDPIYIINGPAAATVQTDIQAFLNGTAQISLRQTQKPINQNLEDFVGQRCAALNLGFIFTVEQPISSVIGCQTTDLSKSAVMWKQSDASPSTVEIAALPFYNPLLDQVLGSQFIAR
jgi:hypothetical protein